LREQGADVVFTAPFLDKVEGAGREVMIYVPYSVTIKTTLGNGFSDAFLYDANMG
jgi:hypothetical protein